MLWIVVHVALLTRFGVRDTLYDSQIYLNSANHFIEDGSLSGIHYVFYLLPISLLALLKFLFGSATYPYIVVQIIASGLASVSLYLASTKLFNNFNAGLLTGIIYLTWFDNLHWNTAVMTDSLACSISCFIVYQVVFFEGKIRQWLGMIFLLSLGLITRPTGMITVLGVFAFLFYFFQQNRKSAPVLIMVSAFGLGLLAYIAMGGWMFSMWDFTDQYIRGNVITYIDTLGNSEMYTGLRVSADDLFVPDATLHPVVRMISFVWHNPITFLEAAVKKLFFLLLGIRPYYSFAHNVFSIVWTSFIYFMFYRGLRAMRTTLPIKNFVVATIGLNCLLVACATLDWDNRFYLPMEPMIVLVCGGFASRVKWIQFDTERL
jgi:4-amino-4-deoxy-L-arabinose transferase-like glycosyltransferase